MLLSTFVLTCCFVVCAAVWELASGFVVGGYLLLVGRWWVLDLCWVLVELFRLRIACGYYPVPGAGVVGCGIVVFAVGLVINCDLSCFGWDWFCFGFWLCLWGVVVCVCVYFVLCCLVS